MMLKKFGKSKVGNNHITRILGLSHKELSELKMSESIVALMSIIAKTRMSMIGNLLYASILASTLLKLRLVGLCTFVVSHKLLL